MKFDLSSIELSKNDLKRGLKLPSKLSKELAEMIGIMIGDGHIAVRHGFLRNGKKYVRYNINISGNSDEEDYLNYVTDLFYSLFNITPDYNLDPRSKAAFLRTGSKGLVQYLAEICKIPLGRKTNTVFVPEMIKVSTNEIKCAFLRGLADTDFSVTFRNRPGRGYVYPRIAGSFKSKALIQNLGNLFKSLGFRYCVCYNQKRFDKRFASTTINNIYLNGTENFEKWIINIGFSNPKFQRKVGKWQRDGVCPPGY